MILEINSDKSLIGPYFRQKGVGGETEKISAKKKKMLFTHKKSSTAYKNRYLFNDLLFTHGPINLPIAAIAYFINTLDGERSVHGRCEPKCFKDGDLF